MLPINFSVSKVPPSRWTSNPPHPSQGCSPPSLVYTPLCLLAGQLQTKEVKWKPTHLLFTNCQ